MRETKSKNDGSIHSYQDVFRNAQKLLEDIQELRIGVLPQPRLIMLHERAAELRKGLCRGAKVAFRQKKYARAKHIENLEEAAKKALSAIAGFFALLKSLSQRTAHDLLLTERELGYNQFYADLAAYKKEIRAMLSTCKEDTERARTRLAESISAVHHLKKQRDKLVLELHPKLASYDKIFDSVFHALEKHAYLAPVNTEVTIALRGVAYPIIASSYVFDREFYLGQLPDAAVAPDCIKHYLTKNTEG